MTHKLDAYIGELRGAFELKDRRAGHERSRTILRQMTNEIEILFEVFRRNMSRPDFFSSVRGNPVIGLPIIEDEKFSLIAHCWLPLPPKAEPTTHQSIHHHGKLLLTSAAAFGPGYDSIIFKAGFEPDAETRITHLEVDSYYTNHRHQVEFVDARAPHVVFYPEALSVTYALWSPESPERASKIKRFGFLQKNKKALKAAIDRVGLSGILAINKAEYLDFYPCDGRIVQMQDRVTYPAGTKANFVQNLFFILQSVGFSDAAFLDRIAREFPQANPGISPWIQRLRHGERIEDVFEPIHLNIPKVNIPRRELLGIFPDLAKLRLGLVNE